MTGGIMRITQMVGSRKQHGVHAPAFFTGSAAVQSFANSRTIALVATIFMVAFALYMTCPAPAHIAVQKANTAAGDNGNSPSPAERSLTPTQSPASQNASNGAPSGTGTNNTRVTVNGQNIPVPADGNLHQTIQSGDSTTELNLSSGGTGNSSSSTNITIQSNSSSSTDSGT